MLHLQFRSEFSGPVLLCILNKNIFKIHIYICVKDYCTVFLPLDQHSCLLSFDVIVPLTAYCKHKHITMEILGNRERSTTCCAENTALPSENHIPSALSLQRYPSRSRCIQKFTFSGFFCLL